MKIVETQSSKLMKLRTKNKKKINENKTKKKMLNITVRAGLPIHRYKRWGITAGMEYKAVDSHITYKKTDGKGNCVDCEELMVKVLNDRSQVVEVPTDMFVECASLAKMKENHFSHLPKAE